jgi:hypothetical protein
MGLGLMPGAAEVSEDCHLATRQLAAPARQEGGVRQVSLFTYWQEQLIRSP